MQKSEQEKLAISRMARALVNEYESLLQEQLRSLPKEYHISFLNSVWKEIIRMNKGVYNKMGCGYKPAKFPRWMYNQQTVVSRDGKKIVIRQDVQPNVNTPHYLDHFSHARLLPTRDPNSDKWKYVSNPYKLTSEELQIMIEEMKRYGVRFEVSGESNYEPGRTFQIRFGEPASTKN
ncbi:MAG TPA: hypothetical protein VFS97_02440 [Nitrososphaeraceae archaeon]|nr:hypothetical protein [Nitrososphaeraceae archaeon]